MKTKIIFGLLFTIMSVLGCEQKTSRDILNNAAIHFAGVFITENVQSVSSLRIEGKPFVKNETDSSYYVSGSLEGFSPLNYPVSVRRFVEKLHYLGGEPTERKNWLCIEIYVDNKKMK